VEHQYEVGKAQPGVVDAHLLTGFAYLGVAEDRPGIIEDHPGVAENNLRS
jgi:hypothetical protein